ncbi:hypothetical protein TEA_025901 [Camellia sinensis var. sinensis]|uniref:Disease resistance R13L4/SHOC-2-like LRR domain-containing protein n=1 Tax=Camellia sinensis var. sinensis TaxID=542762 RepID=A0A4S4DET3_CAMSN|nr:hypothetical protein TEA_025901 [Camellia sinensis var. sinensis]
MRFTSLRSLLVFVSTRSSMSLGKTFSKGFKLLGVLELELAPLYEFPPELTEMIHLRYLSLRSTMLRKLPESIGKLKKLEILDLKHCLMTCISSLPNGILKLKHLCQLRAYGYCFESSTMFASTYGMNLPGKIGELTNLQKLGNVEVNDNGDMLRELGKLTQLRRLGILKLTQENGMELCSSLENVFPEDYLIKRIKIIRLWVVERFVEEKPGLTAEEDVEDYLNELVSRSMIQVVQKDNFNRVRTCCVHDIMREIIQLKSRDISFAMILLNDRRMSTDEKIRRMSIHANCKEELPSDMRFTSLRSLLVFVSTRSSMSLGKTFFKGFKLLGVLELELAPLYEFPPELTEMIHLRYLSLRSTMLRKLPESIGKLKKLEILDLKHCLMTCISSLPNGILKLKHLCQLRAYGYCFESSTMFASTYGMNLPGKIGELTNLQKLGNVEVNDNGDMLRELGKLTQLRRLGILKLTQENGMELCSLEKLKHLTALYMVSISTTEPLHLNSLSSGPRFLQRLYLKYSLPTLPKWIASLQYLAKLVLQHSNLNDDPLKSLHGLPNLVVLELREAFVGEELCCNIGGYPRLKKLSLQQLSQLKCLRVEQGAMPGLRGLDIAACEKLEMVPLGIKHLRNLQRLMVWFMPWRFYQTIARPHGEDFWKVQHIQTIEAIY